MIELKRAKDGKSVLTLQYELTEGDVSQILDDDVGLTEWLGDAIDEYSVAFLDRPEQRATIFNLMTDVEEAGPAEFHVEVVPEQPVGGADRQANRDARFDEKPWWDRVDRAAVRDDDRFAPVVKQ